MNQTQPPAKKSPEFARKMLEAFDITIERMRRFVDTGEQYLPRGRRCAFCNASDNCGYCPLDYCGDYAPDGNHKAFREVKSALYFPNGATPERLKRAKKWARAAIDDLRKRKEVYANEHGIEA